MNLCSKVKGMRCYRTVGILLEAHLHVSVRSIPVGQKPCLLGLVGLYCVPRMTGLRTIITSPGTTSEPYCVLLQACLGFS